MQIVEVTTPKHAKEFLALPVSLYRSDPNWIRPLDDEIEKVFNPQKNKYFRHGECTRWLLEDAKGNVIGRVAAFLNKNTVNKHDQPTGGMGFFECINSKEAAFMLFDTCRGWLAAKGIEAMDGPINFGERNYWWGLLIEGFTPPTFGMNYNHKYYIELFEAYGFQIYYKQLTYGLGVNEPRPDKYYARSKELMKDPDYHWHHLDLKKVEQFTEDFRTIYNKAFAGREGIKTISIEQARSIMKAMKPIAVDYLLWLGYYKEEPIAAFFMIPELNGYMKHVNGKMNLWGKIKYLYHKVMKTNRKMFAFVFGVVPEFQGRGVEGGIIMAANNVVVPKKRWDEMELTWIGDFNPKMMRIAENLGSRIVKTHATYRYLFDRTKEFKRMPIEH